MQVTKNQTSWPLRIGVYLALPAASIYHGMKYSMPLYAMTANVLVSLILAAILDRFVRNRQGKQNRYLQNSGIFIILFVAANLLMAWGSEDDYGYLWLLPVVVATVGTGIDYGMAVYLVLLIQNVMLHTGEFNSWVLILNFLYGIFTVWILSKELRGKMLPYLLLSMLSFDAVLQILQYQFQFSAIISHKRQVAVELISILLLELFLVGYLLYRKWRGAEPEAVRSCRRSLQAGLEAALREDHALLVRMQEYSEPLYRHSMRISTLAAKAAAYMGGNVQLAQAGGLYHAVGKIIDPKNYLHASVQLLKDYDMPEELQAVVSQHSAGYPKPQSMEAAIVMMSERVIYMSDGLEKKGKREAVSDQYLVEMAFKRRLEGGNLAESGLSEEQIEQLKTFYAEQAFAADQEAQDSE